MIESPTGGAEGLEKEGVDSDDLASDLKKHLAALQKAQKNATRSI